jgi:hypothetical protein
MALLDPERLAMIEATRDIAWDMVDDLDYMRTIIAKPEPASGELRRMSNLLRRLLIDNNGDIRKVAVPRLVRRLHLSAPDLKQEAKDCEKERHYFTSMGTGGLYGLGAEVYAISRRTIRVNPPLWGRPQARYNLYGRRATDEPTFATIGLPLDSFLSQRVLYFEKQWIRRGDVIRYIANVARGVHAGSPKQPSDKLLHRIRQIGSFQWSGGKAMSLRLNHSVIVDDKVQTINVSRDGIDFVLLQLVATARLLTMSPDVLELETIIRAE